MESKTKKNVINSIGIIFLIFGATAIINAYRFGGITNALWLCYFGLNILGIGILMRKTSLIKSQLNILSIPLLIWWVDFIYFLFNKNSLLNIVDYFFRSGPLVSKIISTQHLFTIPLGIISLKLIKKKTKKSWLISMIQLSIVFITTRLFTNYQQNINWVYHTNLNISIPYYPLFWFLSFFIIVFFTDKTLSKIFKL